jgi:dolichol-phosphate mannosyltransferase
MMASYVRESQAPSRGKPAPSDRRPISVVVPTLNERDSIMPLFEALTGLNATARGFQISELVFVDDGSSDGTVQLLRSLALSADGLSISVIERQYPVGPANAEICGICHCSNDLVVKLDADGQHPVSFVEKLLQSYSPDIDLVIASRYIHGGESNRSRIRGVISRIARLMAKAAVPSARRVGDPVSGYFLVRRNLVTDLDPSKSRYKLLLHILAANSGLKFVEVPYRMEDRRKGQSKIVGVSLDYAVKYVIELVGYWRLTVGKRIEIVAGGTGTSRLPE